MIEMGLIFMGIVLLSVLVAPQPVVRHPYQDELDYLMLGRW